MMDETTIEIWPGATKEFLEDVLLSLDGMPRKELVWREWEADGSFCVVGALCNRRGIDTINVNPTIAADILGVDVRLVEAMIEDNDCGDDGEDESGKARFIRMRKRVVDMLDDLSKERG